MPRGWTSAWLLGPRLQQPLGLWARGAVHLVHLASSFSGRRGNRMWMWVWVWVWTREDPSGKESRGPGRLWLCV